MCGKAFNEANYGLDNEAISEKSWKKMRRFTYLDENQFQIDYGDNIVQSNPRKQEVIPATDFE
jgi:hypothetical protein